MSPGDPGRSLQSGVGCTWPVEQVVAPGCTWAGISDRLHDSATQWVLPGLLFTGEAPSEWRHVEWLDRASPGFELSLSFSLILPDQVLCLPHFLCPFTQNRSPMCILKEAADEDCILPKSLSRWSSVWPSVRWACEHTATRSPAPVT